MTTLIAFVVGLVALFMPFYSMTIIYLNRKNVAKNKWKISFGILTDETRRKSIYQLYYYPIFMFQRLAITFVVVYADDYPTL